jgi:hypothetical protein
MSEIKKKKKIELYNIRNVKQTDKDRFAKILGRYTLSAADTFALLLNSYQILIKMIPAFIEKELSIDLEEQLQVTLTKIIEEN